MFVLFTLGRVYTLETSALRPRNNFVSKDPKERFPYDLGFDPLGFYAKATPSQRETMAQKELNNGRLAMIAMTLYPCIEFASKQPPSRSPRIFQCSCPASLICEKFHQLREFVTLSLESNHPSLICDKLRHLSLIYDKLRDVRFESNYIKTSRGISFLDMLQMRGVE